jgi:3-methyladenine DNA glycosylase/8-oxoguanine DNA glycosylase
VYSPTLPVPGLNLKAEEGWTPQKYLKKIGGDTEEYADKFESVQEIFNSKRNELKTKGIPVRKRKYILKVTEYFRRGVLTFEKLEKRTAAPRNDDPKK